MHLTRLCQSNADTPAVAAPHQELRTLQRCSDAYLRHDLLEENNQPVTFSEFEAHVQSHRLQFLCEADFASMFGADLSAEVAQQLPHIAPTTRQRESLIDLITQRPFRQSILCHAAQQPCRKLQTDCLERLYAATPLREVRDDMRDRVRDHVAGDNPVRDIVFRAPSGWQIEIDDPLCVAALRELRQAWPASRSIAHLITRANSGESPDDSSSVDDNSLTAAKTRLAAILLSAFASRAAELHVLPSEFARNIAEYPTASPLARLQAESQTWVTNLRHDVVPLDEPQRALLRQLDGTLCRRDLPDADLQKFANWALLH